MDTEDLLDRLNEHKPMSTAYRLICEDAEPRFSDNVAKKLVQTAKRIVKVTETAKMKLNFNYKNLDYWTATKVKHPLLHCQEAVKATTSSVEKFQWIAPKKTEILLDTSLCSNTCRIFIEIPDEIFGNRDFLNLTYAAKRAHYACSIANLLKSLDFDDVSFVGNGPDNFDLLYPEVNVGTKEGTILIGFSNESIAKNRRFIPTIGNLRPSTVFKGKGIDFPEEVVTPKFNQRFLSTIVEPKLRKHLENQIKNKNSIRIALRLLVRFLNNRHLSNISSLVLPARVLRLINQGQLTDKQEVLTVIKIIVKDIITWDPSDIEYILVDESLEDEFEEGYKQHFEVNLIHDFYNIAHRIGRHDVQRAKNELTSCLSLFGDIYAFDSLFIEQLPVHAQFDHYARFTVNVKELKGMFNVLGFDAVNNDDLISNFMEVFEKKIYETMSERFESMKIVRIDGPKLKWDVGSYADEGNEKTFLIGFRANSQWSNPLTVGPQAQNEEAKVFRQLWKGVSELRKFADTRICECVVWANEGNDKIVLQILQFILQKIFELPGTLLSWRNFDHSQILSKQAATESVAKSFASLSAVLRSLKGIPLMITNVYGISPYIRGSEPILPSVFAAGSSNCDADHILPEGSKIPPFTPAVTVHIKLEFSGKWGNEVEAIRRLTSSFYVKIAEKLRERELIAVPTIDQIFVIQNGIVFKLIIVHDKILDILEEKVEKLKDSGATRIESSLDGMRLAAWKKRFITEPLLQLSLQSFATSHRMFGNTVQIFKRWLGSKLLSGHIDDLVIELLTVSAISKKGFIEPRSSWCAFVRVLHLIVNHNWLSRPLIVDLGKNWTEEERAKLEENFIKMRPILPPMVIITDEDVVGSKFTRENPSGIVLKRLIALAEEALKVLEKNAIGEKSVDLDAWLLQEDYSAYDGIIELERSAVVRKEALMERKPKAHRLPVVEYDPVDELVFQLNNNFHQVAMFFYNKYGGTKIGIKFKPSEDEVPAKIGRCLLHKSVSESALRLNKDEIIENIKIIGRDIVSEVRILGK